MLRFDVQRIAGDRQPVPSAGFGITARGRAGGSQIAKHPGVLSFIGNGGPLHQAIEQLEVLCGFAQGRGQPVITDHGQRVDQPEQGVAVVRGVGIRDLKAAEGARSVAPGKRQPASQLGQRGVGGTGREKLLGLSS